MNYTRTHGGCQFCHGGFGLRDVMSGIQVPPLFVKLMRIKKIEVLLNFFFLSSFKKRDTFQGENVRSNTFLLTLFKSSVYEFLIFLGMTFKYLILKDLKWCVQLLFAP